jgi:hypothetical protein
MKLFYLLFIMLNLLFISAFAQEMDKQLLQHLWKDTIGIDNEYKPDYVAQINELITTVRQKKTFPQANFAFVAFYHCQNYTPFFSAKENHLVEKTPYGWKISPTMPSQYATLLTDQQVNRLLQMINNPLNFSWFECGTALPEGGFVFFNREGQIVAYIEMACAFTQCRFSTQHFAAKYGQLTKTQEFFKLIDELWRKK